MGNNDCRIVTQSQWFRPPGRQLNLMPGTWCRCRGQPSCSQPSPSHRSVTAELHAVKFKNRVVNHQTLALLYITLFRTSTSLRKDLCISLANCIGCITADKLAIAPRHHTFTTVTQRTLHTLSALRPDDSNCATTKLEDLRHHISCYQAESCRSNNAIAIAPSVNAHLADNRHPPRTHERSHPGSESHRSERHPESHSAT